MEEDYQEHILVTRWKEANAAFVKLFIVLLSLFVVARIGEILSSGITHGFPENLVSLLCYSLGADLIFLAVLSVPLYLLYSLLYVAYKPRAANLFFITVAVLVCLVQAGLAVYFNETLVPLGGDLWQYSGADIMQTVGASGSGVKGGLFLLVFAAIVVATFIYLPRRIHINKKPATIIVIVLLLVGVFNPSRIYSTFNLGTNEYSKNLAVNKSSFFYSETLNRVFNEGSDVDIYSDSYSGDFEQGTDSLNRVDAHAYIDEFNYPFLHKEETPDVLSPFFDTGTAKPNIVLILVEGLGRAFTNEGAYLGNFTPFIDSIAGRGLYWENFLSAGGRTFAVLPGILGSLPFGKSGFSELGANMPQHLSLISLLKYNGYSTTFYYGGDAHFDMMDVFLKRNKVDNIYDIATYPAGYKKLPGNAQGFNWGYGDKEIYSRVLETWDAATQPKFNVILTVATHSPFFVNEQDYYNNRFEARLNELKLTGTQREEAARYKKQLVSVCYADDALRQFFKEASKKAGFNNTVFIITGDHRMPEIPMKNKIDRYHVPFIVYSPMLKRTAKFSSVSNHFDVAPTLLAFLKQRNGIAMPSLTSWIGTGIDTTRAFVNRHSYPVMQTKNDIVDYVMGGYMINGTTLFAMKNNMELQNQTDEAIYSRLNSAFDRYKQKNEQIISGKKLIPDSIYNKYTR